MEQYYVCDFSINDFMIDEHSFVELYLLKRQNLISKVCFKPNKTYKIKFIERVWDPTRLQLELGLIEIKAGEFKWNDQILNREEIWEIANSKKPFDLFLVVLEED